MTMLFCISDQKNCIKYPTVIAQNGMRFPNHKIDSPTEITAGLYKTHLL